MGFSEQVKKEKIANFGKKVKKAGLGRKGDGI